MLSSGIFKYKPIDKKQTEVRILYPEPVFIYQSNSDRGLRRRFQVGALFHPWGLIRPKIKLNIGLGAVYDWSSWEVNDQEKIHASSAGLQEKILFINSRVKLRKNMYQDYSEWRPMLLLNMNYQINEYLNLNLNTSYQQSLTSPYNEEIKSLYPDLRKVYPYILTQVDFNVKLHKGFSLSLSGGVDYENNNLSLYASSWAYHALLGCSWSFSNQVLK